MTDPGSFLMVALLGLLAPQQPDSKNAEAGRFLASDYPRVSARADFFEERMNSADPEIRREVLIEVAYFAVEPDEELVGFLRRLVGDPDPVVRGRAVRKLHDLWVSVAPGELPAKFRGYHDGRLIDRDDPELESTQLKTLSGEVGGGVDNGYAAYEIGVLGLRSAIPTLARMRQPGNPFVREAAARALFDLGELEAARESYDRLAKALLDEYERALEVGEGRIPPHELSIDYGGPLPGKPRSPWYAILACRGLVECGEASRAVGLARLLRLYECLELSDDVNDRARLEPLRKTLRVLTGVYAHTAREAREVLELPR